MASKYICIDCGHSGEGDSLRCKKCSGLASRKRSGTEKDYRADWIKQKKYGIEPGEFEAWFFVFKGKCGICKKKVVMGGKKATNRASLDHNHKTGKIRGILCGICNAALGFFQDDIRIVKEAVQWLSIES
jgi:DNA-directed RNA polymerase subunit RPC12/RpoP